MAFKFLVRLTELHIVYAYELWLAQLVKVKQKQVKQVDVNY